MMTNQALNPLKKKKVSKLTIILLAGLIIFVLYVAAAVGTALDLSPSKDGGADLGLFMQNIGVTLSAPDVVFSALFSSNATVIGGTATGGSPAKMVFFAVIAMGIFALYKYSQIKKRLHRKGVEHGSAQWGDEKEMNSLKDVGKDTKFPYKEPQLKPLLTSDGKRVFDKSGDFVGFLVDNNIVLTEQVYMSLNSRQHLMNLNVLIIGGSGSGKTRFYAKPNILQLNTSYVITDPKGEILQSVGKMMVEAGYDLKIFNTIEMAYSDNYNPFHYVYDYEGQLSEDSVMKMIDVFMQNTKGEGDKDDFWSQSARKAITAIILLLFEESEYNAKFDENGKMKPETRDFSHLNFFSVTEKMRKLVYPPQGTKDGFFLVQDYSESDEDFQKRREEAFLCPLDKDFIELERRKKGDTLATRLYKEIRNSPQETGQSIIATAGARTQMFNQKNLANLTCCDNICLETLGDKKTALFIIISATNATYNFLAAMMYTQMFDVLTNRANFKYGGTLPVHVRCIMDEFSNVGEIPDFDKVIAFVRSMGMSLNVIIQNLAQLKARYEKTWEVITGNCDSMLFLGGKETSTLKDISESLGKETIDVEGKNRTITGGHKSDSSAESNSILGRELLTPDELQKMPISSCVLMIRSHNPFYCNKFPIEKHPNFRFTEDFDSANAFDKYSVKAKTLEEFAAECGAENPKPKEKIPPTDMAREKLKQIHPKPGEEDEVTSESILQSYEDIENYADYDSGGGIEIAEEFKKYGTPLEYDRLGAASAFEMPDISEIDESIDDFKEVNADEIYRKFSLNDDEDEDNEPFIGYSEPHAEAEQIPDLEKKEIQFYCAGQTNLSALAVDIGTFGDAAANFSMM